MAKIAFTKFGCKLNKDVKVVKFNDQEIEVRQYLPVDEKLALIGKIINNSAEDAKFYNVGKITIFTTVEMVCAYTNISFTEKQKEDIVKLYDLIQSNGLFDEILAAIPDEEFNDLLNSTLDSVDAIYTYRNSVMGILDNVSADYDNVNVDVNKAIEQINNLDHSLLSDVMKKLG